MVADPYTNPPLLALHALPHILQAAQVVPQNPPVWPWSYQHTRAFGVGVYACKHQLPAINLNADDRPADLVTFGCPHTLPPVHKPQTQVTPFS